MHLQIYILSLVSPKVTQVGLQQVVYRETGVPSWVSSGLWWIMPQLALTEQEFDFLIEGGLEIVHSSGRIKCHNLL